VRFHLLPSLKEISRGKIIPPTTGENETRRKKRRKCIQEIRVFPSFSLHHEFKEGWRGAPKKGGGEMLNPLFNMSKSRYHQLSPDEGTALKELLRRGGSRD
jgi:hypothetical protein